MVSHSFEPVQTIDEPINVKAVPLETVDVKSDTKLIQSGKVSSINVYSVF